MGERGCAGGGEACILGRQGSIGANAKYVWLSGLGGAWKRACDVSTMVAGIQTGKCPTDTVKELVLNPGSWPLAITFPSRYLPGGGNKSIGVPPLWPVQASFITDFPAGALCLVTPDAEDAGLRGLLKTWPTECPRRLLESHQKLHISFSGKMKPMCFFFFENCVDISHVV